MKRMRRLSFLGMLAGILLAGSSLAQTAPPAAKPAATPANSLGQKYDTKLPIEISSDTLEVLQHDNKAIFKGNVIAVQGKIRLKSDVMIVHYRQKTDPSKQTPGQPGQPAEKPTPGGAVTSAPSKPVPAGASAAGDQNSMGAISLIEVEGNVFMATPEESAKGDKGDYQVDDKLLHLFGDNVVLTRDKNILRGTELVYNLETGRSVLTNKGAKVNDINGGRVRGVFVPNQENGKNAKGTKMKKQAGTASAPAVSDATPAATP